MTRLMRILAVLVLLPVVLLIFCTAILVLYMALPFLKADLTGGTYHSQVCAFGTYTPCVDLNGWLLALTGFILLAAAVLVSKILLKTFNAFC